ncbi:MAG: hypothetical protein ABR589_10195 [Chthoniobacterales bacterium]
MPSLASIQLSAADKLQMLRRLDQYRSWESLSDRRQCLRCGDIITGREIEVVGGTRESGPLRLQCPTENCPAMPMDWILLKEETRPMLAGENPAPSTGAATFATAEPMGSKPIGHRTGAFLRFFSALRIARGTRLL